MWSETQQLQNGADAGALADRPGLCAGRLREPRRDRADHSPSRIATAARPTGTVLTADHQLRSPSGPPTRTRTGSPRSSVCDHEPGSPRQATAKWGAPDRRQAIFPLTFSWCEWQAQTGGGWSGTTPQTILLTKTSTTDVHRPVRQRRPRRVRLGQAQRGTLHQGQRHRPDHQLRHRQHRRRAAARTADFEALMRHRPS